MSKVNHIIEKLKEDYEFLHNKKVTFKKLAEISGCTKSAFSNYKNGISDLPFYCIIRIVRFLSPEREKEIMKEICLLTIKSNRLDSIRQAMEYCSINRYLDELKIIIENQLNHSNQKNKEWAKLYEITYRYQIKRNYQEPYEDLLKIKPTYIETRAFFLLLESIFLYGRGDLKYLRRTIKEAELWINKIDDEYIRSCYLMRTMELYSILSIYADYDLNKSREYAQKVLDSDFNKHFKGHSIYLLATSFILEDYDKSMYYFNEYIKFLKSSGRDDVAEVVEKQDVVFLKIINGKELNTINTYDISEIAHMEARWGDKEKALNLLDEAEKAQGKSFFKDYYRSLALNDPELMFEVLVKFLDIGNKFHAHVVLNDLKKFPIYGKTAAILLNNLSIK